MHCTQTQTKIAASKKDVQVVQQISLACTIAKQALEAIGNLQSNDIRNVAALTATNSSSTNSIPASSLGLIVRGSIAGSPSYNSHGATAGLLYFAERNRTLNETKRNEMRNKPVE